MLGPILECEPIGGATLRLVTPREEWLPLYIRWLADPQVNRYLTIQFGLTAEMESQWFQGVSTDPNRVSWTIELDDEPIGVAGIEGIDWIARTGRTGLVIGDRGHWRKGIATSVMRRRARYAFDRLNLAALYTESFTPNEASRKAAEAVGYREYGRRPFARYHEGRYLDAWLGVLTREGLK